MPPTPDQYFRDTNREAFSSTAYLDSDDAVSKRVVGFAQIGFIAQDDGAGEINSDNFTVLNPLHSPTDPQSPPHGSGPQYGGEANAQWVLNTYADGSTKLSLEYYAGSTLEATDYSVPSGEDNKFNVYRDRYRFITDENGDLKLYVDTVLTPEEELYGTSFKETSKQPSRHHLDGQEGDVKYTQVSAYSVATPEEIDDLYVSSPDIMLIVGSVILGVAVLLIGFI